MSRNDRRRPAPPGRLVRDLAVADPAARGRSLPDGRRPRPGHGPTRDRGDDHRRRLRRRLRRGDPAVRPDTGGPERVRRHRPPRPLLRPRRDHPRRRRARRRARLVHRASARPRRRVLRLARHRRGRDDVPDPGELADDAVPRPGVVLDLAVHPLRDRLPQGALARGGAQVPRDRRVRLRRAPFRLGARLRRDREADLRRDRRGSDGRRAPARRAAPHRAGDDHRRARLQGVGGPVPYVDTRRLRRSADLGDGVHGGRDQGGGAAAHPADPRHGVPAGGRSLDDRRRGDRRLLARAGQLRRARPEEPEAAARVLVDLERRLHADRRLREQRAGRAGAPLLPDSLRGGLDRGLRRDRRPRARTRPRRDRRRPGRDGLGAAPARRCDVDVHALASPACRRPAASSPSSTSSRLRTTTAGYGS